MKKNLQRIMQKPFVKNVAILVTGTAGAQAISMVLSPIITRLYGPEVFGILGAFTSIVAVATPIVALTYPIAIVLPKRDENAKNIMRLSLYITLFITGAICIALLFFSENIVNLLGISEMKPFLYLIPIVIIFSGIMQVSEQWLIRTKQFSVNAKASFFQSLIINGSKAGMGLIYPSATVLVGLQAISNGVKALIMILFTKKSDKTLVKYSEEKLLTIKELAFKYKDFPVYRAPEVFISSISQNLPILLLATLFGPATAGYYTIGRTVLGLPSTLIGQAIGDVFYPRISEAVNNGENITSLIKKATLSLCVIGIIPFGLVIIFGPWIFEFIFGSGWGTAGEYARWIALASFSTLINKPSVRSMPVLNAQRFHLIFTIVVLLIRIASLFVGFIVYNSALVAIALFSISSLLLNIILIVISLKLSKRM